ncbi:hypothetical protein KIW84_011705 [Lathyrus oleraceus]|uniref:Uncharacterized protein n=1 Tax=Pisum sativum TaxID=3888 RepID=A0A9D5BFM8_PEA|nr:hypothetical protein KIW84_011705 [Pisum sativum]
MVQPVNMVYGCPGSFRIYGVRLLGESLVKKHVRYSKNGLVPPHNYASCRVCSRNSQGCLTVVTDLQDQMDQGFSPTSKKIAEGSRSIRSIKETFHSGGFINPTLPEVSVITEDNDSTWEPYCDDPEYDLEAEDAYVPF